MATDNGYILFLSYADAFSSLSVDVAEADDETSVNNLLINQPKVVYRSSTTSAVTITGAWDTLRPVSCMVLYNHNVSTSGTIRFQLKNNTTNVRNNTHNDTDSLTGWGQQSKLGIPDNHCVEDFTAVNADNFEIEITDGSVITEAGRFLVGDIWQPEWNFEWGIQMGWADNSQLVTYADGSVGVPVPRQRYRQGRIRWTWLTDDEALQLYEGIAHCGVQRNVFINPYPNDNSDLARSYRLLAHIVGRPRIQRNASGFYDAQIEFREAI